MKKCSPKTARTNEQICRLRRDNIDFDGGWCLVDESDVHICLQKVGESPTALIDLPKSVFNRIVAFYTRPTSARK